MNYSAACLIAAACSFSAGCSNDRSDPEIPEHERDGAGETTRRATLENGLSVTVVETPGLSHAALVVLYDIGEHHDPPGGSGLGHLVEHCYVTAAAGTAPARTMGQFVHRYPRGWNAQTGGDFTVIATVFDCDRLETEIVDAAARMGGLRVTAADLAREKPRMARELENMFKRMPRLAAANISREIVLPTPRGGRKGGLPAAIAKITLETVRARVAAYYRPNNAAVVLAGGFAVAEAWALIERYFGSIPRGTDAPKPASRPEPKGRGLKTVTVNNPLRREAFCAVSYRAPRPSAEGYPAFLAAVARLQAAAGALKSGPRHFPVAYRPLDDPDVLTVTAAVPEGGSPEEAARKIDRFITETLEKPFTAANAAMAKHMFGHFLGTKEWPAAALQANLYGYAFSLGRRRQLGIDPAVLAKAFGRMDEKKFREAVERRITGAPAGRAAVIPAR